MSFEDALITELLAVSGLATGKVFWANQTVSRPSFPYIAVSEINRVALTCFRNFENNPTGSAGNPSATPPVVGTELLERVTSQKRAEIRIDYFQGTTAGSSNPDAVLDAWLDKLRLTSSMERCAANSIAFIRRNATILISDLLSTRFEGHATVQTWWHFSTNVTDTLTYIGSATVTGTAANKTSVVTLDLEVD